LRRETRDAKSVSRQRGGIRIRSSICIYYNIVYTIYNIHALPAGLLALAHGTRLPALLGDGHTSTRHVGRESSEDTQSSGAQQRSRGAER